MFTVKFYNEDGSRIVIKEAESFTILRDPAPDGGGAEITLHQKNQNDDTRTDIGWRDQECGDGPRVFAKAIIENSSGRTTEIIARGPHPDKQHIIRSMSASGSPEYKLAG